VFIMPHLVCIYVHKIVLQFYVYFCAFIPHVVNYLFPCLTNSLSCPILSHAGLLEVHPAYRGSLGYFLAQSLLLPNGCSLKRLMLMGAGVTPRFSENFKTCHDNACHLISGRNFFE
jgi:hypothetical protein